MKKEIKTNVNCGNCKHGKDLGTSVRCMAITGFTFCSKIDPKHTCPKYIKGAYNGE